MSVFVVLEVEIDNTTAYLIWIHVHVFAIDTASIFLSRTYKIVTYSNTRVNQYDASSIHHSGILLAIMLKILIMHSTVMLQLLLYCKFFVMMSLVYI